jgi:crotonobetainyl-CoA:carnitine CoA-transferase CaiB-like acyl-CoA transferase
MAAADEAEAVASEVNDAKQKLIDRSTFTVEDSMLHLWYSLGLPAEALCSLHLTGEGPGLPSSFKIGHLAQTSIALSALTAALIHSLRNHSEVPRVTVPLQHAVIEFKSERLYLINGESTPPLWGPIGGLHKAADGYVRIHDNFPNHRQGALNLLGCPSTATRSDVASAVLKWKAVDLETAAFENNIVITALRTYEEWDALPQAKAISNFPITIRKIAPGPPGLSPHLKGGNDRCLCGLKVLELSRVIAAPVSGKTLAAHGADVIWITSPNLPDLPALDRDLGRGKRTVQLDLRVESDRETLKELAKNADVFIQGYRPGALAAKAFSPEDLAKLHPGIIYGTMSAYGPDGPWSTFRGFDSLVQTCSGMNVSEAEHFGTSEPVRPTPCQALDHAAGYFLAAGISAALYMKAIEGGSYAIDVSLAGVMKYLRSLGQYEGKSGFDCWDPSKAEEVEEYLETRESGFGELRAVKHCAAVEGAMPGWDVMPKPLGSDCAEWL